MALFNVGIIGPDGGRGTIQVNASDANAAVQNASQGGNTPISGATMVGGGSTGGGGPVTSGGGQQQQGGGGVTAAQLDAQFQKMLGALASGNKEAFEEAKREFNATFEITQAGVTGSYQGNPTLAAQLQQANLTGQYNGQPTEATRQFNQSQQQNLGTTLLNAATQLRGPADYAQYQQLTHGGASLYDQLFGPNATQPTSTPSNPIAPASLQGLLQQLGLLPNGASPVAAAPMQAQQAPVQQQQQSTGYSPDQLAAIDTYMNSQIGSNNWAGGLFHQLVAGGTSIQEAIQKAAQGMGGVPMAAGSYQLPSIPQPIHMPVTVVQPPAAPQPQQSAPAPVDPAMQAQQQILARFGLQSGQQLNPTQIDPSRWDTIGKVGQDLTKNVATTYGGWDPADFENIINSTRPKGTARPAAVSYAAPRGIY